tara:strand:+ start:646 stop:1497 length:852 start_codon:yes stop_codon:yes gene_type:complete
MSIGLPAKETSLEAPTSPNQTGILIVDEDPAFQLGLKTFLREYVGFEKVYTASNGSEAIDLIKAEEAIELITLDYQMPGMTGIEVLEELQTSAPRPLNVIMVTGYPSEELESQFHDMKSPTLLTNKFLSKPVEFEMLEPLMLTAHQELLAAKEAIKEQTDDEPAFFEASEEGSDDNRFARITSEAAKQDERIDTLESKIDSMKKASRARFWTGLLAIAAIWIAAEFGAFKQLAPKWDQVKQDITEKISNRFSASTEAKPKEGADKKQPAKPKPAPEIQTGEAL